MRWEKPWDEQPAGRKVHPRGFGLRSFMAKKDLRATSFHLKPSRFPDSFSSCAHHYHHHHHTELLALTHSLILLDNPPVYTHPQIKPDQTFRFIVRDAVWSGREMCSEPAGLNLTGPS